MVDYEPRTNLDTHDVTNMPPPFGALNLYETDVALTEAARLHGGEWVDGPLSALGAAAGTDDALQAGEDANRYLPELRIFDRFGARIDEVRFHPAYHQCMALAMEHSIHSIGWRERRPGAHVAHAAALAIGSQAEAGTMCPMSMTYASVAALRKQPDVAEAWLPKIVDGIYDAPLRPIAEKRGVTIGMFMTEKQGGSDVRANSTRAVPMGAGGPGGEYLLTGHKWFCSAPMSDAFLTLAYTDRGLSCFLAPRIKPDGARNSMNLMRLKDKLGNRSNASAEFEYNGAFAWMIGEDGRGVATIMDMVHHTRLDTTAGSLGIMRRALAEAMHHVRHRRAFQKTLIDQPVMRAVLADLALDYEAAAMFTMRIARAYDGTTPEERGFARLGVALGKFYIAKRTAPFVAECMECLGGGGYIEEAATARYYREAPVNAIWEGSGNVIALDILRTLQKEPVALDALLAELAAARGRHPAYDASFDALHRQIGGGIAEADARCIAERMALALQAALLLRHGAPDVASSYCDARLSGEARGINYGSGGARIAVDAILARQ
ncbi:acyl-CoA dehydrogenase family protein [Rhodomicrobium sp. Az07]|uniref:acyl-CoA dehydrogenase family protein n=1 Tax=Rhodomicrobium sp. Az07 TaxID=2839034 RepID=UPI001BECEFDC|nr:acyl-CoA dehydrogenase family protein [Rhodomicrobium sp. Az07]MBT3070197.1 acyl-CoA dehydrogenase family protein [Rhodomicrobium sp. Az07]